MTKIYIPFALALSVVIFASVVSGAVRKTKNTGKVPDLEDDLDKALVPWYSCAGKLDGNYIHPWDCTKFMSCVAEINAYERNCAACHVNPDNCPTGRLHYHHPDDACLWSHEAGCVVGSVTTVDPIIPTATPAPDWCDPDNCTVTGDCHGYCWCERDASSHHGIGKNGTMKCDTCDPDDDLYFNPDKNPEHGGVCDFWDNLSSVVKDKYNKDPTCVDRHCEWKPFAVCSHQYWYFHPIRTSGMDKLENCPTSSTGQQLLWDQARKNCHPCDEVKDSSGNTCPC